MKIVKIKGGLGNQLFQYCFAKLLERKTGETIKLDFSSFNGLKNDYVRVPRIKKYNISLQDANAKELGDVLLLPHHGNSQTFKYRGGILFEAALNRKYFFEKDRSFRPIDSLTKYEYLDGYWLNWKYVEDIHEEVFKEFEYEGEISSKTQQTINEVAESNAVFVGVRRGDYGAEKSHYGSFSIDYYDKAIQIIKERVDNPVFYIFSDDIDWVKKNMEFGKYKSIYRNKEDITDDFEEFLIMQSCKHFIIVNSTFHWWAARLNRVADKTVIAPAKWFVDKKPIDIIPPGWIKL